MADETKVTMLTPELRGHVIAMITGNLVDADRVFGISLFEMALEAVVGDLHAIANALSGKEHMPITDFTDKEYATHIASIARRASSALVLARHFEKEAANG